MSIKTLKFSDISVRPSILSQLDKLLLATFIIAIGIPASNFIAQKTERDVLYQTFAVFMLFGSLIILTILWKSFNQRLCLCSEYVSSYSGLLSTRLRTTRLLYEHVRGVEIEQSLIQRMLGLGDLHVGSDVNKGEGEMLVCGIRNPDKMKDLLLERVKAVTRLKEKNNSALAK
jgi:uncharacterized membrane protein YdbT with pleckstrin-like domain